LAGLRFRRQYPIGPYIADFYCHEKKLVVEVDGESHKYSQAEDADRTRYLESLEIRVFRVTNGDVVLNLEGVGFAIMRTAGIDVESWLAARETSARNHTRQTPST
jgi:very-short-patch-repair endonuclease